MADTLREFCTSRGGLGVLIVLYSDAQRFTDLAEALHVSESTLTLRLGEARDFGLVTPEIDEKETSVDDLYRLSERGALVVKKLEQYGVVHAYLTMLDMYHTVEEGREELLEWLEDEDSKRELARRSDDDPYVDPFGEDVTGYSGEK